ncbi:hypothetical protein Tco_1175823 [Tanacetum coccineum]
MAANHKTAAPLCRPDTPLVTWLWWRVVDGGAMMLMASIGDGAAAADDEGVSNGDGDETKVMKDVMGMTMVVDLWR